MVIYIQSVIVSHDNVVIAFGAIVIEKNVILVFKKCYFKGDFFRV